MTMDPQTLHHLVSQAQKAGLVQFGKAATPSDVYRNPVLENVSSAAFQDSSMFVARAVFPTIPSSDEQFKYYSFNMDSIGQDKAKLRAPGTESEEGVWDVTAQTVLLKQYAYKEKVPEELQASAGAAASIDEAAALSVAEVLMINAERRFAANFFTTGKWARDMLGAATADATHYVYWNSASSTPIDDVYNEKSKILLAGKRLPNTMVLGFTVAQRLLTNSQIINRLNNGARPGQIAMASLDDLAKIFGVDRVLVAGGVYNAAKEGATASPAFCLDDKSAWLGHVAPRPSIMTPSAGYRGTWAGLAGNDMGVRTFRYFDIATHSWKVETIVNDEFVMVNDKLGTFFSGIVQ
jgi:hypothetical protein